MHPHAPLYFALQLPEGLSDERPTFGAGWLDPVSASGLPIAIRRHQPILFLFSPHGAGIGRVGIYALGHAGEGG